MCRFLHYICGLFVCLVVVGQDFQRTAEEIAMKQTIMLDRDVDLDSAQLDTVYRINLRYVRLYHLETRRDEVLKRLDEVSEELKKVLTKEQYAILMQKKLNIQPRRQSHTIQRTTVIRRTDSVVTPIVVN